MCRGLGWLVALARPDTRHQGDEGELLDGRTKVFITDPAHDEDQNGCRPLTRPCSGPDRLAKPEVTDIQAFFTASYHPAVYRVDTGFDESRRLVSHHAKLSTSETKPKRSKVWLP